MEDLFSDSATAEPTSIEPTTAAPNKTKPSLLTLEYFVDTVNAPALEKWPPPPLIVGYKRNWLEVSPPALQFWEKALLEPYPAKKDITYFVLCPDNEYMHFTVDSFFRELSCIYSTCKLGAHRPVTGLEEQFPNGISRVRGAFDVSLPSAPSPSSSSSAPSRSDQGFLAHLHKTCSALAAHLLANGLATPFNNLVIYIVSPYKNTPRAFAAVCRAVAVLLQTLNSSTPIHPVVQILPFGTISNGVSALSIQTKVLSFSIYTKCRNVTLPNASSSLLYEPLFIIGQNSPPTKIPKSAHQQQQSATTSSSSTSSGVMPSSSSAPVSSSAAASATPMGMDASASVYVGDDILHVAYGFVEAQQLVVAVVTDSTGELLETTTIEKAAGEWMAKLWEFCLEHLVLEGVEWTVAIGKLGDDFSGNEKEEWHRIISAALSRPVAGLKSVALVHLQFDRNLQLLQAHNLMQRGEHEMTSGFYYIGSSDTQSAEVMNSFAFFPVGSSIEEEGAVGYIVAPTAAKPYFRMNPPVLAWPSIMKVRLARFWAKAMVGEEGKELAGGGIVVNKDGRLRGVVRHICYQYHALSWITANPQWPTRASVLPMHFVVLKHFVRLLPLAFTK